jgi:hypothetical protein
MIRKNGIVIVLMLLGFKLFAQPYLDRDQSIEVISGNKSLSLAWLGGLNNPEFSAIDFNNDDVQDLFIFDKSGNVIIPIVLNETDSSISYLFDAKYVEYFPELSDWVLLRDFNCDGYPDIFTYSKFGAGAMTFKNKGQVGNDWFSLSDTLLYTFIDFGSSNLTTNIFISRIDLPSIIDYDNDGDLDIFTFQLAGFQLEFYKNFSVEKGNGCDLDFELKNRCWGYFGEIEDTIVLGQNCFNVVDPERKSINDAVGKHTGSTVLMLDLNADGNLEVVMGDIGFDRLTAMLNGGPSIVDGLDSIIEVNYQFPDSANPGGIRTFPASFYVDVNNDQIKDLIVAPNSPFASNNANSVKLYLNSGANDNPVFDFQTNSFLQQDMIDIGEGAYPLLFDVNNDDLTDLLIGNRKLTNDSIETSAITYYKNTGSAKNPQFEFVTNDYFEISQKGIGLALYPAFMDINGDNATDLLLGNLDGNIYYIINTAIADQPFNFSGDAVVLKDNTGTVIDAGMLAKPQAVDLNFDNLKDLVIGNRSGYITYFENTGSSSTPEFSWRTDSLGHVQAPGHLLNTGNSAPLFYIENGQQRLVMGSEIGDLVYYKSIMNNLNGTFEEVSGPGSDIKDGMRTAVTRADINNDGLPDLIVGNYRGGICFYRGDDKNPNNPDDGEPDVLIYPNPVINELIIEVRTTDNFEVSIFDNLGRVIFIENYNEQNKAIIEVNGWASGNYFAEVLYDQKRYVYQLIIIH